MIYPHPLVRGSWRGYLPSVINFLPEPYWWAWRQPILIAVMCLTAGMSIAFAYNRRAGKEEHLVLFAVLVTFLFPLLLPQMFARYFYLAEMLSIILAFYKPSCWGIAFMLQLTPCLHAGQESISALIGLNKWFIFGFCVAINTVTLLMLLRAVYGGQIQSGRLMRWIWRRVVSI